MKKRPVLILFFISFLTLFIVSIVANYFINSSVRTMELQSYKDLRKKLLEFSEKAEVLYVYFMRPN